MRSNDAEQGTRTARMFLLVMVCFTTLIGLPAWAGEASEPPRVIKGPELSAPVTPFVFDGDLRDLPRPRAWRPGDPIRAVPQRFYRAPGEEPLPLGRGGLDPLLEIQIEEAARFSLLEDSFTVPSRNFAGIGFTGAFPPDTVGDAGPDHYIQMVNDPNEGSVARVWDKAEPLPTELATFAPSSLTDDPACEETYGDPIVTYDRQADRWLLVEMSRVGNYLCAYVSQTADPVSGGWYAYTFATPVFPDYPKPGVWATDINGGPGSYVVTTNEVTQSGVYALDRAALLAGQAASYQRLVLPKLTGFVYQTPAPADTDGPSPPPSGSPAVVMRHHDTEIHDGPEAPGDLLELWLLDVDWQQPSNTTLTQAPGIDVAEFDSTVCGLEVQGCFPQPGTTTTLMPLREPMMHRLQYYNHGDFESLTGNFTIDVDGYDRGGVRWFELRRTGGEWFLQQEGTYSIDGSNRWMASIAMDQTGNIALGHNVVSSSVFPSLRYTGRMRDDYPGTMTQPETEFSAGQAFHATIRWGDYSAMSLDPTDDCTFWFTGEDMPAGDNWSWRTQIVSFRFADCGCDPVPQPVLGAAAGGDNQIDLFWEDSASETVTDYIIRRAFLSGGPFETIAVVDDSSPGFAGGPGYVYEDVGVSGGVAYYYVVVAREEDGCRSRPLNEVSAVTTGSCFVPPLFGGLQSARSEPSESCYVDLAWGEATPLCDGPAVYNVYRSDQSAFTPGPENLHAGGLTETTLRDMDGVDPNVTWYYVVRALDLANQAEDQNDVEWYASATGPETGDYEIFFDDFDVDNFYDTWTVVNAPDHECREWERGCSLNDFCWAMAQSAYCPKDEERTATSLLSPTFDVTDPRVSEVALSLGTSTCEPSPDDIRLIEAWDGSQWQLVIDLGAGLVNPPWDITQYAAGNPDFRFRFRYEDTDREGWWTIDDVKLTMQILDTCSTGGPTPPTVAISSPEDGSSFASGSAVLFAGSATDPEDDDLSDGLVWTSSLDGPVGTGASFSYSGLSTGNHTILAEATDSDLLTGSDSVEICVVSIEAPNRLKAVPSRKAPTITLRWADNSDNETRFEIERSLAPTSGFAPLDEVGTDATKYTDTGLESQTTYYYRVRACVEETCSGWSDVADATTY